MIRLKKTLLPAKISRIALKAIFTIFGLSMLVISLASVFSVNEVIESFDVEAIESEVKIHPEDIQDDDLDLRFGFPVKNDGRFPMQKFQLTMQIIIHDGGKEYMILDHSSDPETIKPGESENVRFRADEDDYEEDVMEDVLQIAPIWPGIHYLDQVYHIRFDIFMGIKFEYAHGLYSFQIWIDVRDVMDL